MAEETTKKPKNRIEARLEGNVVELRFIASDEEMAHKFFDLIEAFGCAAVRVDLEREWKKQEDEN